MFKQLREGLERRIRESRLKRYQLETGPVSCKIEDVGQAALWDKSDEQHIDKEFETIRAEQIAPDSFESKLMRILE